jgi:acid phosphatase
LVFSVDRLADSSLRELPCASARGLGSHLVDMSGGGPWPRERPSPDAVGVRRATVAEAAGRPTLRCRPWALVVTALVMLITAACAAHSQTSGADPVSPPVASTPGAVPRPEHVLVVVFENKDDDQVIGSPSAPYLTSLAGTGANLTDAHGERHPSRPNYVALLSGSTQGVRDDSCPQDLGPVATLASQLATSGHSFVGYSEALPAPGFTGCTSPDGRYACKHNPWVDFTSTPPGSNQPLSAMPGDFAALPTVAVVIRDLCHDMHDCPVNVGDSWARDHLSGYVNWAALNPPSVSGDSIF